MATPKAQWTGGQPYEPTVFDSEGLRSELAKLYRNEVERQLELHDKLATGGSDKKCFLPLNGKEDAEKAWKLGVGAELDNICPNKSGFICPSGPDLLRCYFNKGGSFAELFASELVALVEPAMLEIQAAELLCRPAELTKEANSLRFDAIKLAEHLHSMSPGILWNDQLVSDMKSKLTELVTALDKSVKRLSPSAKEEKNRKSELKTVKAEIAKEMSIQALSIMSKFQFRITACAEKVGDTIPYTSTAVDILMLLRGAAGLTHGALTVRNNILSILNDDKDKALL